MAPTLHDSTGTASTHKNRDSSLFPFSAHTRARNAHSSPCVSSVNSKRDFTTIERSRRPGGAVAPAAQPAGGDDDREKECTRTQMATGLGRRPRGGCARPHWPPPLTYCYRTTTPPPPRNCGSFARAPSRRRLRVLPPTTPTTVCARATQRRHPPLRLSCFVYPTRREATRHAVTIRNAAHHADPARHTARRRASIGHCAVAGLAAATGGHPTSSSHARQLRYGHPRPVACEAATLAPRNRHCD
jgi:hypothetical protein